ncbi:MAG TPA: hypothetical protein VGL35_14705 [Rhizomicrobium sp.]|jgi:hypothetical protein
MNRPVLLLGVSVLALCASGAFAGGPPLAPLSAKAVSLLIERGSRTLYNQNSDDADIAIASQNLTSGVSTSYDAQGADDFLIPKGQTWRISEIDVTGQYFSGFGPANSENLIFYKDRRGMPGRPVRNGTFNDLKGSGGPDFSIVLPGKGVKLQAGRYWVSVIANIDFQSEGLWGWEVNTKQHGKQAMWQNPSGKDGTCRTWGTLEDCTGYGPDFMFSLRGKVR